MSQDLGVSDPLEGDANVEAASENRPVEAGILEDELQPQLVNEAEVTVQVCVNHPRLEAHAELHLAALVVSGEDVETRCLGVTGNPLTFVSENPLSELPQVCFVLGTFDDGLMVLPEVRQFSHWW